MVKLRQNTFTKGKELWEIYGCSSYSKCRFIMNIKDEGEKIMIRPIMKDIFFLNQKSEPATESDKQIAIDLLDTLKAHEEGCVGMAANMIGVKKCIIAVNMGFMNVWQYSTKDCKKIRKI